MSLKDVQARLGALGFYAGSYDGLWGPKTEAAVQGALDRLYVPPAPPPLGLSAVTSQPKASRPITEIIFHCTATPEGRDYDVPTIRGWHKARGFSDIGYHYVVHLDGLVEMGRPEAQVGAHVINHNAGTLGVAYVGGLAADGVTAKDTRTPAQRKALLALRDALRSKYPGIDKVSGHNDWANKACPSFKVGTDQLGGI